MSDFGATLGAVPEPGLTQVYRDPNGLPTLFVRSEVHSGHSEREYLFAGVQDRIIVTRWYSQVPPELELIHDAGGREEAVLARADSLRASWERRALVEALKKAMAMLPVAQANRLRAEYVAAVGE